MSPLSRREFLKRSGLLGVGGAALRPVYVPTSVQGLETFGRAFTTTSIFSAPDTTSTPIGRLLPDETTAILEVHRDWYHVERGYVQRNMIQPITSYIRRAVIYPFMEPFWAEVIAPSSVIYAYCAASAPFVRQIGYGAVVCVIDSLCDDWGQTWYALAAHSELEDSEILGWSTALQYAVWTPVSSGQHSLNLHFSQKTEMLTIWESGHLTASIRLLDFAPQMAKGEYVLRAMQPGVSDPFGAAWKMQLGDSIHIQGAHWRMVESNDITNKIELSTLAARWLYHCLLACPDQSAILVVE